LGSTPEDVRRKYDGLAEKKEYKRMKNMGIRFNQKPTKTGPLNVSVFEDNVVSSYT
jgi:hypothetical protein